VNLRYFNPVGAHSSWLIGENPSDTPNNLLPYIMKVASGELKRLSVYWDDYDTLDGTGVRDYIHVEDLASGHLASLEWLQNKDSLNEGGGRRSEGAWIFEVINLWTWNGTSVMEMIAITEQVTGKALAYSIVARRPWDIASAYCNPQKAEKLLGWKAEKSVQGAVADSWKFIQNQNQN
jgi:UDP-glucose 4-epimerase